MLRFTCSTGIFVANPNLVMSWGEQTPRKNGEPRNPPTIDIAWMGKHYPKKDLSDLGTMRLCLENEGEQCKIVRSDQSQHLNG
jgi:hypothetical protein